MTIEEIYQRVVLARTPTVATEDALTVAKLHDIVVEFVLAERALERIPLDVASWRARDLARTRIATARVALEQVSGVGR